MHLKNDIPVRKIYRHELIYDVAPFKKCRLTIFNSSAQSFFNFDSHFFEYKDNSHQALRCSFKKIPRWRKFSFSNLESEVLCTKSFRKQGIVVENSKKVLSIKYELVHSDAWFRKKVLPYYLSLIKKYGKYSSSWSNLLCLHGGKKITLLGVKYPQRLLLRIRNIYYHCLIQWVQQFTHAALINFNSGAQLITIEGQFARHLHSIRTWMCNISNFNFSQRRALDC